METKPYNLQSPEQIAKDYGGNKQKIAEAMQMGILDPTAGTLAGMFIDRMRSAQQQEMAPQQTVAQQVFAPPMPPMPAGLGATPQAAAMAPPPPMGAPMGAPPAPPMEAMPPQGMAMGGLTSLSLPDNMFDEPDNGGYASGGLVAFDAGGQARVPNYEGGEIPVTAPEEEEETPLRFRRTPINSLAFDTPREIGGLGDTLVGNAERLLEVAPRQTQRAQEYAAFLEGQLDPAERERRRKEDLWTAIGQFGARMASTPGSLLQAIGAGVSEAVPTLASAARARRGEEREVRQAMLAEERTGNQELTGRAAVALEMLGQFNSLAEARQNREFENYYRTLDRASQEMLQRASIAAGIRQAQISTAGGITQARIAAAAGTERERRALMNTVIETINEMTRPGGAMYAPYTQAVTAGKGREFLRDLRSSLTEDYGLSSPPSAGGSVDLGSY